MRYHPLVTRETLLRAGFGVGTALLALALFHVVQRTLAPKHTLVADMRGKNVAAQVVQVGHVLAVLLLVPGIVKNCVAGQSIAEDSRSEEHTSELQSPVHL